MNARDAEVLISTIKSLVVEDKTREVVAQGPTGAKLVRPGDAQHPVKFTPSGQSAEPARSGPEELERLYQYVKQRILDESRIDPMFLKIITQQPELVIEGVEPRRVTVDGGTTRGRVARLIASGFFDVARTQGACRAELKRTGSDVNSGSLSTIFNDYVKDGFFHREGADGYIKATGLKITQTEVVAL